MSTGERWTIIGVVVAVIGVIATIAAILVAHRDADAAASKSPGGSASISRTSPPSHPATHSTTSTAPPETPTVGGLADGSTTPTARAAVHTYKNVPLKPLCDSDDCSGTQQVGSTVFSYTDGAEAGTYPQYFEHQAFQATPTSCSDLTIRFSGDSWAQEDGHPTVDYLKFVQQNTPTVYATVGVGKIATVHVHLDGGPLYIDSAVANDPGIHNSYVELNVTGTCSTPDGIR